MKVLEICPPDRWMDQVHQPTDERHPLRPEALAAVQEQRNRASPDRRRLGKKHDPRARSNPVQRNEEQQDE